MHLRPRGAILAILAKGLLFESHKQSHLVVNGESGTTTGYEDLSRWMDYPDRDGPCCRQGDEVWLKWKFIAGDKNSGIN
jgi:hypothetical protein